MNFLFRINLVLVQVFPTLAAQSIADHEFEDIKRDVRDEAENPYNTCPSPPNSMDPGKTPVCIHGNDGSQLILEELPNSKDKVSCIGLSCIPKEERFKFNDMESENLRKSTNQLCNEECNSEQDTRAFKI